MEAWEKEFLRFQKIAEEVRDSFAATKEGWKIAGLVNPTLIEIENRLKGMGEGLSGSFIRFFGLIVNLCDDVGPQALKFSPDLRRQYLEDLGKIVYDIIPGIMGDKQKVARGVHALMVLFEYYGMKIFK